MEKSIQEAVKELQNSESVYVAYSQATNLPYVTCGAESYNDQVWIFQTEEGIKEFGKKLLEENILIMGMKYEKQNYPRFYGILYSLGINSVIWSDAGDVRIEIELPYIAKPADLSQVEPAKRPMLNPTLQLSGMYFMQEVKRPVKMEERKNVRELEEELLANLVKAQFIMPVSQDKEAPGKFRVPLIKNKEGKVFQPVFSDVIELEKYTKGAPTQSMKIAFKSIRKFLNDQAEAVVINPLGFNLVLNREQLDKIIAMQE